VTGAAVAEQRITVIQGEWRIAAGPDVVLTTVLGSCVAACVRDPVAGVGGMNHFLLPEAVRSDAGAGAERYGVHLMELLINALLKAGARREALEAKLFGGASAFGGSRPVGPRNIAFAEAFLRAERIAHRGGSTGGEFGRRLEYWPATGRARQVLLTSIPKPKPTPPRAGTVELF
jgi:chemotaxis protein CheD